jgi:hypothetical protein
MKRPGIGEDPESLSAADGLKRAVVGVRGSDFQQIQGGQQIKILDGTIFGRENSWLPGVVAGFYFILNQLNLLASLNLLEQAIGPVEIIREDQIKLCRWGASVPSAD